MKKKSTKFTKFINSTNMVNYKDSSLITSHFNESVSLYKKFNNALNGGDEKLAAKYIMVAATNIYQSCEWSIKNYLERKYRENEENGKITKEERIQLIDSLSRKETRLYDLINEMRRVATPTASECNVNYSEILRYSSDVNNYTKHDAKVPNPADFKIVLGEVRKIILSYVDNSALLDILDESLYGSENSWYELLEECDDFSDTYSFILITGPISESVKKNAIFNIKWDLVIDMDAYTDINGIASVYSSKIGTSPWMRKLNSIDSKRNISYSNITYWVLGNGISDDPSSIVLPKLWKSKYLRPLSDLLENFHRTYTKPAKVIIYPFGDERNLESIIELFNITYSNGDDVDFYILSPESEYSRIDSENFHKTSLSITNFCENIDKYSIENKPNLYLQKKLLPSAGGTKKDLLPGFLMELSDSFEILYEGIEFEDESYVDRINREAFYKGVLPISWYGLKEHFDIERSEQHEILSSIHEDIKERGRLLKKITYEAGSGGTTFMRRLAWELREKIPVLILKKINDQTPKNIQKVYDISFLPIIIFADSNNIEYVDAQKLHSDLKAMGFAFIICFMERKVKSINSYNGGFYGLIKKLNNSEAPSMKSKLIPFCIDDAARFELDRICQTSLEDDERSPFIMSMYAFDKNFHGVKSYIANFLRKMNDHTKKLLFSLALADYSNALIDKQYFIDLFNDLNIENFLMNKGYGFKELAKIESINGKQYIKIKYHLFADEILKQISNGEDSNRIIFINLVDYILDFISSTRTNEVFANRDSVELLRTLFVTRMVDSDSSRPIFSPLIAKLNEENKEYISNGSYNTSKDAIVRIFGKLVEIYPEEPHFTAHLARYYFYIDKDYEKGFANINKAIELSEVVTGTTDPRLYHMKAMGFSSRIVNTYIKEIYKNLHDNSCEQVPDYIEKITEDAEKAFLLFQKVRENNIGLAGHISDILLCIQIANTGKSILEDKNCSILDIVQNSNDWVIKYIDRALLLFDECKKMAIDSDEEDIREIEMQLNQLTANLEDTIAMWEEYLKGIKGEKLANGRRMLARAYQKLFSQSKKYSNQDYIRRILQLMEENIEEEPNKSGNIRIWFEAIRNLITDNQDSLMMDAVIKLNRWIALTDSVEAHYYRFVIKFIQSVNGSTSAKSDLPKLLRELKAKSALLYNRTSIIEWLGNTGNGLDMLFPNTRNKKSAISEDEMANNLYTILGRISNNYVNESHAYISYDGTEIYFNPAATKGEIDRTKINQRVRFGVGFSYDGPRAFNSSIKLVTSSVIDELALTNSIIDLPEGEYVKCEVIGNNAYYVNAKIIGTGERGSIHINDLIPPYSSQNRPIKGQILDVRTLKKKFDNARQTMVWGLSMKLDEPILGINDELKKKLEKIQLDSPSDKH